MLEKSCQSPSLRAVGHPPKHFNSSSWTTNTTRSQSGRSLKMFCNMSVRCCVVHSCRCEQLFSHPQITHGLLHIHLPVVSIPCRFFLSHVHSMPLLSRLAVALLCLRPLGVGTSSRFAYFWTRSVANLVVCCLLCPNWQSCMWSRECHLSYSAAQTTLSRYIQITASTLPTVSIWIISYLILPNLHFLQVLTAKFPDVSIVFMTFFSCFYHTCLDASTTIQDRCQVMDFQNQIESSAVPPRPQNRVSFRLFFCFFFCRQWRQSASLLTTWRT